MIQLDRLFLYKAVYGTVRLLQCVCCLWSEFSFISACQGSGVHSPSLCPLALKIKALTVLEVCLE